MDDVKVEPSDYKSSEKFGGNPLAEALWVHSLSGTTDEEAGTVDDIGWHGLLHFEQPMVVRVQEEWISPSGKTKPIPPVDVTIPVGSYILTNDSTGFVDVAAYELRSQTVKDDWQAILDGWDEWFGDAYDGLDYIGDYDEDPSWD